MNAGGQPPDPPETPEGTDPRVVFQVEVEPGADPISGSIRAEGEELDFVGWVGLAGALERILQASPGGGP